MINNKLSFKKVIPGIILLVVIAIGAVSYPALLKKSSETGSQTKNDQPTINMNMPKDAKPESSVSSQSPEGPATPATTTPPQIEQSAKTNTSDWKTYTNAQYGYKIKYPKDWYLYSDNSADVAIQPDKEMQDSVPGPHTNAFEIKVKSMESGKSLSEMAKAEYDQAGIDFTEETMTIARMEGLKTISDCEGVGCGAPEWFVARDGKLYNFNSNLGYSKTFDLILSTFEFAK